MRKLIVLGVVGLIAQLVDGSLGMAYGVTSTSLLLAAGTAPAVASASVHFAEVGTTLVSGASHCSFGNVDWRMVGILAVPGAVGALPAPRPGQHRRDDAEPYVAGLLLLLGVYVLCASWPSRSRPTVHGPGPPPSSGRSAWSRASWTPRWRRLGPGGHVQPARVGPSRAPQGRRLGGHLGVRRRRRRPIGFLFALAGGHPVGLRRRALIGGVIAAPFAAYIVRLLPARCWAPGPAV